MTASIQRVLFVCLGNICRSPLAEGIFAHLASQNETQHLFCDSAGTAAYHIGKKPDPRSIDVARSNGIAISNQRARQLQDNDFEEFDLILCMDRSNLSDAVRQKSSGKAEIALFMTYAAGETVDVPDPYYGGPDGFDTVFRMLHEANQKLLDKLA
ncbi:MAG: low molecular weight protein-tyrosine-phosphatase [Pseudomonadota bacterium]